MDRNILPPCDVPFLANQTRLILSSYRHWTGKILWPENKSDDVIVKEVFFAPFILASAGNEPDPILNYGNQRALELWGMDWKNFTQTPGRHTAEPEEREQRERFLKTVQKQGYIDDYSGIRISASGLRFKIERATVWNLIDAKGIYKGQAATFTDFINNF